jgi:hypothetical protein
MVVRSVDILKRGPSGLFQTIACFPITSTRLPALTTIGYFLSDAGSAMSCYVVERAGALLWRVEHACKSVTADLSVDFLVGGSIQLGAALLRLSDVDALIRIQPSEGEPDTILGNVNHDNSFMQKMYTAIKVSYSSGLVHLLVTMCWLTRLCPSPLQDDMPCAQGCLRPIARGSSAILTIQVADLPSIDLSLCICDSNGTPVDDASRIAWNAYMDGEHILTTLVQSFGISFLEIFQGALRIIKLWAHNRDVYGAATGFLGGGGWAVWLAHFVLKEVKPEMLDSFTPVEASRHLALNFFAAAAKHDPDSPIALSAEPLINHNVHHPGTLAVLPPCSDGDFGRAMTRSTTDATLSELKRTLSLPLYVSLKPRGSRAFFSEYPQIVAMKLFRAAEEESTEPAELKALGCTNFLALLVLLEKQVNHSTLRPKSRPLRIGREWSASQDETGFVWIVGLAGETAGDQVEAPILQIESDLQSQLLTQVVRLRVEVLALGEALQRVIS